MSPYIDGYHSAYCSWCFEKTTHKLIEKNYLRRNVYECLSEKCKEMKVLRRFLWSWPGPSSGVRLARLSVGPTAFQINGLAS